MAWWSVVNFVDTGSGSRRNRMRCFGMRWHAVEAFLLYEVVARVIGFEQPIKVLDNGLSIG